MRRALLVTGLLLLAAGAVLGSMRGHDTAATNEPADELIAFVSDRDGDPEIYLMKPDGSGQTRVTNDASVDAEPAWGCGGSELLTILSSLSRSTVSVPSRLALLHARV
jgi:TolB protein